MPVFSLWKMDEPCMETYLSSSTSVSFTPSPCLRWRFSLRLYCPTLYEAQHEQFPVYHFLLTSSSCLLTFSTTDQILPLQLLFTDVSPMLRQIEIRPQRTSCYWPPAVLQTTVAACGRQMSGTDRDREVLALLADRSCEKELSLTWELAFVNT